MSTLSRTKQTLYKAHHWPKPVRATRGVVVEKGECPCQPESRWKPGGKKTRHRLPVVKAKVCTKCNRRRDR